MKHAIVRRAAHRRRAAQAGALTAALLLTLTACGGGTSAPSSTSPAAAPPSDPTTGGTGSSSALAISSPAPSSSSNGGPSSASASGEYVPASADGPARNVPKPVMPEAMTRKHQAGAEAAVKYWWDAIYYLQQTNDPEPMLAASTPDCDLCSAYTKAINRVYEKRGWHTGTKPTFHSVLSQDLQSYYSVTSLINLGPGQAFTPQGSVDEETVSPEELKQPWSAIVVYDPTMGQWKVREMKYEGQQ